MEGVHRHCAKCISRHCKITECPMVNCIHGCGAIVHQCKIPDHEEVCYQKRIPCINAVYGCEAVMPRNRIKVHLAHCPASLVHCKFAWERVDRNLIKNQDHTLPLPNSCSENSKPEKSFVHQFLASDMEHIENCVDLKEINKELNPMLKPSVAHYLLVGIPYLARPFPYRRNQKDFVVKGISPSVRCFCMTAESSHREQLHVVIQCNEVVRRDEFEDHYTIQHNIIHGGLYGWLAHHCPLNEYGCNFSVPRLLPSPQYFELVYNKCSRVFAATLKDNYLPANYKDTGSGDGWYMTRLAQQRELAAYGYDDVPTDPLSHLPIEVFRMVISFLDSSSLFCLSLASQKLRELCHNLIKGNMVQFAWKHNGECWKDMSKVYALCGVCVCVCGMCVWMWYVCVDVCKVQ